MAFELKLLRINPRDKWKALVNIALRLFSGPKQVPCQLCWYIVCMRADYGMVFEGVSSIYYE